MPAETHTRAVTTTGGRRRGGRQQKALRLAALREVEQHRRSVSVDVESNPIAALQEVLDGWVADLRFAQSKVNELPEDEVFVDTMVGKMPNHWIKLRDEYRQKLEYCANNMVRNGIFDRAVNGGEPVNLTPSEDQAKKIAEAIKKAELR